jgi:uroporphyrinogen III methyltransferase/synthase
MSKKQGRVYLIGAGPGHPELITVRGQRLLRECDAVVYDYLLADELIVLLPESVEKHYVGKRAGQHMLPQDEINALLVTLATEGKNVARLKGGDPFIFGCGSIEAAHLRRHEIEFEIVPGITAGIAGPAYAGIPATDRTASSYLIVATGHDAKEKDETSVDWQLLAQAKGGTLVLYMGVKNIAANVGRLVEGGMPAETPAAIIRRGTFADQESWRGTLASLPQLVEKHQIKPPVVFVIGKVVELQSELEWFKKLPLLGKRIMVTRPAAQAKPLYRQLRDLGAEVLTYPTIKISELDDTKGWIGFSSIAAPYRWLVFTSANGVRFFVKQFVERYGDIRKLSEFKIAAIGSGSERALHEYNLRADFIPSEATVATLAAEFVSEQQLDNTAVVRVRGDLADNTFEAGMERMQVHCVPLTLYRTESIKWPPGMKEKLLENRPDAAIFTSSSTVAGLRHNLAKDEIEHLMKDCAIISIGPMTSDALRDAGLAVSAEAKVHTVPGLVEALLKHFTK